MLVDTNSEQKCCQLTVLTSLFGAKVSGETSSSLQAGQVKSLSRRCSRMPARKTKASKPFQPLTGSLTFVTEALSTAGNGDCVLDQLLTEGASELGRHLHLIWRLKSLRFSLHFACLRCISVVRREKGQLLDIQCHNRVLTSALTSQRFGPPTRQTGSSWLRARQGLPVKPVRLGSPQNVCTANDQRMGSEEGTDKV